MLQETLSEFDFEERQRQSHQALLRQLKQELREKSPPMTAISVEVEHGVKSSPRRKILTATAQPRFV